MKKLSGRQHCWISSVVGNAEKVRELNDALSSFYSKAAQRRSYQELLDSIEEETVPGSYFDKTIEYLATLGVEQMVEIGCSNGRSYRQLREKGCKANYTGIEMADYLIDSNCFRHGEARWLTGSAYEIPLPDASVDVCYSFFVIEHLVYPVKGLLEMTRILKKGGRLCLGFPDMVRAGSLPSQHCGYGAERSAKNKWRAGKKWDAVVTYWDSHVRLPYALRRARCTFGPFPINLTPMALAHPDKMWPDIDAVYLASSDEIADWAVQKGYDVAYPCGTSGEFRTCPFMEITV
jgi:SAM-dependent methyltransferase